MQHLLEVVPGGIFFACIYDRKWWIGIVKQKSDEHDNNLVSFMTPRAKEDICWEIVTFCALLRYRPSHHHLQKDTSLKKQTWKKSEIVSN